MSEKKYPHGFGEVKWVSTDWLEEHLEDERLMILDVQPDIHDYIQVHIPGAVYMSEKTLRVPLHGTPGKWIPPEAAQMLFRRLGLDPEVPVVVYTDKGLFKGWGDGLEQTMVAYSLVRFGHNNIYVLDGGPRQMAERRETDQPGLPRSKSRTSRPRCGPRCLWTTTSSSGSRIMMT